jgi:hypothetical protein
LDIYWNILTMHGPINVKSPNNTSKWHMGFNSAFKGLTSFDIIIISRRRSAVCDDVLRRVRKIAKSDY